MPSRRDLALVLYARAGDDLVALRLFAENAQIADSILGFHAQQAVEKALKAVLAHMGVGFERSHDLMYLIDLLRAEGLPPPVDAAELVALTDYAVGLRYDDPVEEEPELDRVRVSIHVELVVEWAGRALA